MSKRDTLKQAKKQVKNRQEGGGPSGFSHFWYSSTPTNIHTLNKYTLDHLDNSPMFNPLLAGTEVATPTSGLIPTGVHLGNGPSPTNYYKISQPLYLVGGGEKETVNNNWILFAKTFAQKNQITFKEALASSECQNRYRNWKKKN
jgi:hypothetical protein